MTGCQTAPTQSQRIGEMVMAIDQALAHPEAPHALETIARYGTDSRHYVMIRGWLVQELRAAESQMAAASDPVLQHRFSARVQFLRQAIRRIDLE
ncbi:MAG: hypothetical protein R3175_08620 [Marinobacter sp.]|uniref:hypothetical protein n=1 Tax=Marinobacter sp. TaxID=50741 RepID=UPI00299D0A2B|nr:hypothetical protein [Marinobacter sp.]MDX1756106.1 hypothetical protein [Marinobacter sp.]